MAYGKLRDLVLLARELQGSSVGLTIDEICEKTERSRKTVHRMLNGLEALGLEATSVQLEADHWLTKRWRSAASQKVLRDARKTALAELRREALMVGADAVIAIDLDYQELSGGGKSGMLMIVASGTAVRLKAGEN